MKYIVIRDRGVNAGNDILGTFASAEHALLFAEALGRQFKPGTKPGTETLSVQVWATIGTAWLVNLLVICEDYPPETIAARLDEARRGCALKLSDARAKRAKKRRAA